MRARLALCSVLSVFAILGGGLAASTSAAAAGKPAAGKAAPHDATLPGPVSQTPVKWTPDVFSGGTCGNACKHPAVYATAVVNGEVIVGGSFGQICTPAKTGYAQCPGRVDDNFLFAFNLSTGAIDPGFTPVLNAGPVDSLAAGPDNTVYVGGAFTTVNGTSAGGLAQLSVTPGQAADGQLVPGFAGTTNGTVTALAWDGVNALYVAGEFSKVDGTARKIARVSATTGALDKKFNFTLSDPAPGQVLKAKTLALTNAGTMLAIAGTFLEVNGQADPRLALINTGGGYGQAASLDNWGAPILANNCSNQHDYINGLAFAPDGSYLVIADTGYMSAGGPGVCDSAARFDTTGTGLDIQPYWVNYTGGDTLRSAAITDNVVYIGGHQRWANNECGNNRVCEQNAVLVNGIAALDPATGLALPYWHPQTARGVGVESLVPYPAGAVPGSDGGLLLGTNVNNIGGTEHDELALFPMTTTTAATPGGPIPSGMFLQGRPGGQEESGSGVAAQCVDEAGDSTTPGTPVELVTCANDNEQNWSINPDQTVTVNGLCLDAPGGTGGSPVLADSCDSAASQQWQPGAGDILTNVATGLCLDDPGSSTTSGTALDIASCDGSAGQSWPLPVSQAPPPPPATGPIYPSEIQSNSDVPCLTQAGSAVQFAVCLGKTTQGWTLEADGTIQLGGQCLDTQGSGTAQGTLVVVATCDGGATQTWTPQPNGELVNSGAQLCLDDPGFQTKNGTNIQIWSCNDGSNQQWWLPTY